MHLGPSRVNAAVFRTAKTNARTPGINPGDPPTVLQGELVVSGVEWEPMVTSIRGCSCLAVILHGQYDHAIEHCGRSGREFANTPITPESLGNLPVTAGSAARGRNAVRWQPIQQQYRSADGPAYWLVDAMAAYRVSDQLTLRLNG